MLFWISVLMNTYRKVHLAKEAGKELVMTPIWKEAFVFFDNPENKIDSLAVSEI